MTKSIDYYTKKTIESWDEAALASDLQLEHIKELHYNVGNFCADLEFVENHPPLGINLVWRKSG